MTLLEKLERVRVGVASGLTIFDAWCATPDDDDSVYEALIAHIRPGHERWLIGHDDIPREHALLWVDYAIAEARRRK